MYITIKDSTGYVKTFGSASDGDDIAYRVRLDVEIHNRDYPDDQWEVVTSDVWPPVETEEPAPEGE